MQKNIFIISAIAIIITIITVGIIFGSKIFDQPDKVFCTQDAKQCPDGSYVSRTGPKCEFSKCPGEN